MVPPDRLVSLGLRLAFDRETHILDLCCGYGEMLKLWHTAFGIRGVGVDVCREFIECGRRRQPDGEAVHLICGDAQSYADDEKYDVVCCTEAFGDIRDIAGTIAFLEKYAKPNGKLLFGRLYAKTECPPKALTDFDGEIETLADINRKIRACGYNITALATDTDAQWEDYITWSAKRDLEHLRRNPNDQETRAWLGAVRTGKRLTVRHTGIQRAGRRRLRRRPARLPSFVRGCAYGSSYTSTTGGQQ